jgi:pyruvate/2-oxoglutarate dehydrogenase complex dihydrolipoamide dehydrogenase (E3) component
MDRGIETDLCVIGGGSAGLSVAAGAAQMGARVVLVERGAMGGDCLNVGCVPSNSLLAAGHAAASARTAADVGVELPEPRVDFAKVHAHIRRVIAEIAPNDSVERFEGLGVKVVRASARFLDGRTLEAGNYRIRANRFVVATGSRPATPPIPGLDAVAFLTNETVFDLTERPEHLVVVGAGPIGCELAQGFTRLGTRVTLLEKATALPKDDPDAVAVVRESLARDGVEICEGADIVRVERDCSGIAVVLADTKSGDRPIRASHLLIAAGRQPELGSLGLDQAGVAYGKGGIEVDARLRTSNHRIYAIGDVVGGLQFTHVASHHASIVLRNALFRLPAKVDTRSIPWVTYTDPELAQVGLDARTAHDRDIPHEVVRWDFSENDRARTERATGGFVKLVVDRRGRPLGATIVGAHAGELAHLWVLAIQERIPLSRIAQMVAPYPTLGEAAKRAAGSYFTARLFSERTHRLVRLLLRLP